MFVFCFLRVFPPPFFRKSHPARLNLATQRCSAQERSAVWCRTVPHPAVWLRSVSWCWAVLFLVPTWYQVTYMRGTKYRTKYVLICLRRRRTKLSAVQQHSAAQYSAERCFAVLFCAVRKLVHASMLFFRCMELLNFVSRLVLPK